jgi:hypothetical protein
VSPSSHLKTETDSDSETMFSSYLEFGTMDKIHKPSDSDCCTPPSEPFKSTVLSYSEILNAYRAHEFFEFTTVLLEDQCFAYLKLTLLPFCMYKWLNYDYVLLYLIHFRKLRPFPSSGLKRKENYSTEPFRKKVQLHIHQWWRHYATNRKVAGSISDEENF